MGKLLSPPFGLLRDELLTGKSHDYTYQEALPHTLMGKLCAPGFKGKLDSPRYLKSPCFWPGGCREGRTLPGRAQHTHENLCKSTRNLAVELQYALFHVP